MPPEKCIRSDRMKNCEIRERLDQLIRENEETYASVSRLLGRNGAYIQQFIKRGSPERLDQADVARLAAFFDVAVGELGGKEGTGNLASTPVVLPVGTLAEGTARRQGRRLVDRHWLAQISSEPAGVEVVVVEGHAMSPTVKEGDEVFIQLLGRNEALRDGLYAIRGAHGHLIRRLALEPAKGRYSILTDSPEFPNWENLPRRGFEVAGRVIWIGRRVP